MGNAWLALMPLLLCGCVPPAVAVASYVVDGVSYAASGKSLSDHGISVVKDEDCASWHFFVGRAVCEDPGKPVPPAPLELHARASRPAPVMAAVAMPKPAGGGG